MSTYQPPRRRGQPPIQPLRPRTNVTHKPVWRHWLKMFLIGLLIGALIAVPAACLWAWAYSQMPGYVSDGATVIQVSMTKTQLSPQIVDVHLTLYDANHHPFKDFDCYTTKGNNLIFYGDILAFKFSIPGLYSGYKITRIDGCYQKPTYTASDNNTLFIRNDGHDSFFTFVEQDKGWLAWLVEAHSVQSFLRADTKTVTYNLLASPQAPQGLSIGK